MERGIVFQQVLGTALDGNGFGALQLESDTHRNRNHRADVNILREGRESLTPGGQMVRVEGDVGNRKMTRVVSGCRAFETTNRIAYFDHGIGDNCAAGVGY